jgi:hypothetical protein
LELQSLLVHSALVVEAVSLGELLFEVCKENHQIVQETLDPNLEQVSPLVFDVLVVSTVSLERDSIRIGCLLNILREQLINKFHVRTLIVEHGDRRLRHIMGQYL